MEFFFYAIVFIVVVSVLAGFVQTMIFPPVVIQSDELPSLIQQELQALFPGFLPRYISLQKVRNRYKINGTLGDAACDLTVDLTPDGELIKVGFTETTGPTSFVNKTPMASASVPLHIANRLNPLLAPDPTPMHSNRAFSGMIGNENAFQIDVASEDYQYEFRMTETGRLVELLKKHVGH